MDKDILLIYKNYLQALKWAREHGNKYGDEDVAKIHEEKLKKVLKKENLKLK